jgi:hypothetical protein
MINTILKPTFPFGSLQNLTDKNTSLHCWKNNMPPRTQHGKCKSSAPEDNRQQRHTLPMHNRESQTTRGSGSVLSDQSNQQRASVTSTAQGAGASQKTHRSYSANLGIPHTETGPPSVVAANGEDSTLHVAGENLCKVWFEACQNSR